MITDENNHKIADDWFSWLHQIKMERPYAANIHMMTDKEETAFKNLRFFKNRFKRSIGLRDRRLPFIPVLETKGHFHFHILLSRPEHTEHTEFVDAFYNSCSKTKTILRDYNKIEPAYQTHIWLSYQTKFHHSRDTVDIENLER